MKKLLLTYLSLLVMLSLMHSTAQAQAVQVVNIATGKSSFTNQNTNSQFLADGLPDGNWTVCVPWGGGCIPAIVGSPTIFFPVPSGGAKWISDRPSDFADSIAMSPSGDYIFKLKFYVAVCNITSAEIILNGVGVDNILDLIWLNSATPHPVNYGFMAKTMSAPYLNNGLAVPPDNITLNVNELQQGWNTLNIRVKNPPRPGIGGPSYMGMVIDGSISITGENSADFSISDINGNKRTSYCVGEDIFLDLPGVYSATYTLSLCEVDNAGNPVSTPVTSASQTGPVNGLNITNIFSGLMSLQGGHQYRLGMTLMANSCSASMEVDFTMTCCELSYDPSFWTRLTDYGQLEVKSPLGGTHNWKIYQVPLQNMGSYTLVGSNNTPSFSLNAWGGCYYITHTITNTCGTSCIGQTICPSDCEQKTCNLSKPENLQYDKPANTITWSNIPGATYLLEITIDDPMCCTAPGWSNIDLDNLPESLPITYKTTKVIPCSTNSYFINFAADFGLNFKTNCFSYKVTAVCPDGGRSSSDKKCSSNDIIPPPIGIIGTQTTLKTGVEQNNNVGAAQSTQVNLYPNPSKGFVSVDVATTSDVEFSISIYDINGRLVKIFEGLQTTGNKASVKVYESLSKGVYLVNILTSDQQLVEKKLIVE